MIPDQQFADLLDVRARHPERLAEAMARRTRRPLLARNGRLFIVAADHPARAALAVGADPMAMADRRSLLDRLLVALADPRVDGVLGTADLLEDLAWLGALEEKVAIGSMNRGGLAGSAWELDDRFTAYDAEGVAAAGLDGGKLLLRVDLADPATAETLAGAAAAVAAMARRRLPVMVEPLPVSRGADGKLAISKEEDALIRVSCVTAGLAHTSAYTWLKIPALASMARVVAATTLPVLLLGGDPGARATEVFTSWKRALAFPQVRGLVAGRALLYPHGGNVADAVASAAAMVHG